MKYLCQIAVFALVVSSSFADREVDNTEDEDPADIGRREKIIIASYGTTTYTDISTKTTVVPYTCYTTNAQACQGRRLRRRQRPILNVEDILTVESDLDTSEKLPEEDETLAGLDKREKLVFTVWQTTTTTATITTTSMNRAFTVSASAYCTYTGFTGPVC